jgi:hypothetical protein
MANRIPLIVDTTDGNKIKELPINDNLDLTNSNLVGVNSVQTQTLSIAGTPFTLQYSELQGAPTIPADISDLTDTQSLLGQGGGGGITNIQGGGGLIVTADDSVARTVLPGNTLKIQGSGNVTTTLTEENGTDVLTIASSGGGGGVADGNTTYTLTGADGDDANSKKLRLRDSTDAIQDITLVAGTNVGITRNSNSLTFTSTDTDTTYGISSAQDGDGDKVIRLQSSTGVTDDLKIIAGTNVSVTRADENSITINNTQTLSNAFGTVRVGVTDVVADATNDTLTLLAGTGIVLTPNAGNDTIQIDSSVTQQNIFQTISGDTGTKTAGTQTDTLNVVGGSSISTSLSGSTLTINYTGNVGGEANNFEIVAIGTPGDNVELIADDPNDVLYIGGGSGITVSATGTGSGPGGAVDQVTITNDAPNVDQNIFYNVADDDDTTITASSITDTLKIIGGTDISTNVVAGELQISYTGSNSNFNVADNFAYKTFAITPSGGSTTASSNVDTLNFQTGVGITMTAVNDLITITNSSPNVDQNIFQNVLAGGVTITADTTTDTLAFTAGTGITVTGDAVGDAVTITNSSPNVDQNIFASIVYGATSITPATSSQALTLVNGGGVDFTLNNTSKSLTIANTSPNVDQNIFSTVRVSGETDVTTASTNGVLTFVAGTNTTLTTDNTGKSVTINSSGSTQNLFATVSADAGNTTANSATDTLTVTGGSDITTAITGDTLTITNASPNVDQNLFANVAVAGQSTVTAETTTDTLNLVAGTNVTITTDAGTDSITINASGGGGSQNLWSTITGDSGFTTANTTTDNLTIAGGTGITSAVTGDTLTISSDIGTRGTVAGTTSSIANNASTNLDITGHKGYFLYKIQTSAAAWVRIYSSASVRTSDSARSETSDPTPGSGVIAEAITTGAQTVLITPFAGGFNDENPVTTTIPCAVTNKSGSTQTITVTLTVVPVEV